MKKLRGTVLFTTFLLVFMVASFAMAAPKGKPVSTKPALEYKFIPEVAQTDGSQEMEICFVNTGPAVDLKYDALDWYDMVIYSIPLGADANALTEVAKGVSATSLNDDWKCDAPYTDVDETTLYVPIHPDGLAHLGSKEAVCVLLEGVMVNATEGVAFITIDQQIDSSTVGSPSSNNLMVWKTVIGSGVNLNALFDVVNDLAEKLDPFDVSGTDLYIDGYNVHIRNGMGSTTTTNGTGNLVMGYNSAPGNGSHNIIGGYYCSASSYAGFVTGYYNYVNAPYASVSGGYRCSATGYYSSVTGGVYNTATYYYSTVNGGYYNTANYYYSTVNGGYRNTADYYYSTCNGGYYGTADYYYTTTNGGYHAVALGYYSMAGGGYYNTASGYYSAVTGGYYNTASGYYSKASGGYRNTASGYYSSVLGGYYCSATTNYTAVGGGSRRGATSTYYFRGGGEYSY